GRKASTGSSKASVNGYWAEPLAARTQQGKRDVNINEIRRVLKQLEELYAAAGAAGAAKDLKSVVRMLDGHGDKSIEEFVAETKALLSGATEQKTSAEPKLDVVSSHSERLLSAGEDLVRF